MTDNFDLADEIAVAILSALERPGEREAFYEGRRAYLVRRDGVHIFEETQIPEVPDHV